MTYVEITWAQPEQVFEIVVLRRRESTDEEWMNVGVTDSAEVRRFRDYEYRTLDAEYKVWGECEDGDAVEIPSQAVVVEP